MKQLITTLILLITSFSAFSQQVIVQHIEASVGVKKKINKVEKIVQEEQIVETIEQFKLSKAIKKEVLKDFKKNYSTGQDYIFNKTINKESHTIKVTPYIQKATDIEQRSIFLGTPPFDVDLIKEKAFLGLGYKAYNFNKSNSKIRGIEVDTIIEGEAAFNAGLQKGDIITAINGKATPSISLFKNTVNQLAPKEEVTFEYFRDGKKYTSKALSGIKKQSGIIDNTNLYSLQNSDLIEQLKQELETINLEELSNKLKPEMEQLKLKLEPELINLHQKFEPILEDLSINLQNDLSEILPQLTQVIQELDKRNE